MSTASKERAVLGVVTFLLAGTVATGAAATEPRSEPAPSAVSIPDSEIWSGPAAGTDWRAVGGGLTLFGAAYGVAIGGAAAKGFANGTGWLAAPVAGPWVALGTGADANAWALVLAGIAQVTGAGIATWGACCSSRPLGPADRAASGRPQTTLVPSAVVTSSGDVELALTGAF